MTSTATTHNPDRRRRTRRSSAAVLSFIMVAGLLALASPSASAQAEEDLPLPIVFVHGGAGSGAQYQAQAMRFASNGIPPERIKVFEYASVGGGGQSSDALDGFIDDVRDEFGVDQVHTAGHSLGTAVMSGYLGVPEQAAKVASYASLDGAPAVCEGENAPNCTSITAASMGQTHVEAATSPESFARQYELFFGEPPATTDILPEEGPVEIAGRAVNFPANSGIEGGTVELWPLDPATGHRTGDSPLETTTLGANGDWGPWQVEAGQRFELALQRPDSEDTIHYYMQPLIRSDYLVRLNLSPADSAIGENTNRGPDHVSSTVVRYREWWTDHESGDNDILAIFTKDSSGQVVEEPVSALDNIADNSTIGVHIHDDTATPQETSQELLPFFPAQVFQSGVDVFMPAEPDAGGTVTFVNGARGMYDMADWQILNTPNWPSDEHHVILLFNDFVQ